MMICELIGCAIILMDESVFDTTHWYLDVSEVKKNNYLFHNV